MDGPFYIVATNPKFYSLSYDGVSDTALNPFTFKDGLIFNEDKFLTVDAEGSVTFNSAREEATIVELEATEVKTNFRIKYMRDGESYYIGHDGGKRTAVSWIFMPAVYDSDHVFVISRYNENPSWARYLPGEVIIYNKGKDDIPDFEHRGNVRIEHLENVGREGHTYLNYMITHYDTLPARVTFLQADPFDHSENILELCCMADDFGSFQSLSSWYLKHKSPPINVSHKYCKPIGGALSMLYAIDAMGHHLEYDDKCWGGNSETYCGAGRSALTEFLERVQMTHKMRDMYKYSLGALFSVRRENILLNRREEYERMAAELIRENKQGGHNGYILEKLWWGILTNESVDLAVDTNKELYAITRINNRSCGGGRTLVAPDRMFVTPWRRYIFEEDEAKNCVRSYINLIKLYTKCDAAGPWVIMNYDCDIGDDMTQRFKQYYDYLVGAQGEWNLFLGMAQGAKPTRIVSRDPLIIECEHAESLTFAIHSKKSIQILLDELCTMETFENELTDRLSTRDGKIWIAWPPLCKSVGRVGVPLAQGEEDDNTELKTWLAAQGI